MAEAVTAVQLVHGQTTAAVLQQMATAWPRTIPPSPP